MNLEKEKVIERIKEAKEIYGLSYSRLARKINMQPVSIYMFINGTNNIAMSKQLEALCVIEKYIEDIRNQLKIIEHKGFCIK